MNRKTLIVAVCSFLIGLAVTPWLITIVEAQYRPVKTTDLMRIDLGKWCEGKEVTIQMQEAGPGTSGRHHHPAHSFYWILDGSETHVVEGRPPIVAKVGDWLHDEPSEIHESRNEGPVKFLQVRIIEKGRTVTARVP